MIRKAVIPAAGFGTRMLPAAKAVPKELLPVLDKPTIQYVVEECVAAGITHICLIVSPDKPALQQHFAPAEALEARLREAGKESLLSSVTLLRERAKIDVVQQTEQLGLGHAVLCAREWVGDEPFACLLGDTIFSGSVTPTTELVRQFQSAGTSVIGLERVAPERVSRYGIVDGNWIKPNLLDIKRLIEKPATARLPLAIAARYALSPGIFDCLERTPRGKGGEIQLTDAINRLTESQPVHGLVVTGRRHDIGNPTDWLITNLLFARRDARLWSAIQFALRADDTEARIG